jgi:hypothetical protein
MRAYLRGLERKLQEGVKVQDRVSEQRDPGIHLDEYTWLDSPADGPWSIADNLKGLPKPFGASFREVIGGKGFVQFVQEIFEGNSNLKGVELGGPGSNVFSSFRKGLFAKTLGVNLGKPSKEWVERTGKFRESDTHSILSGDIYSRDTQQYIRKWAEGGVDFFLSRMGAGLNSNPLNPFLPFRSLDEYYVMLNTGGIMLIELDSRHDRIFPKWVDLVRAQCGNAITLRIDRDNRVMFLQKHEGAPDRLPHLSAKQIYRQEY